MESQHVKSINTDKRSNKRIKFASAKDKSKRASADVYRSYKRKIGATSAATREEAVHNPHGKERAKKRHRAHHLPIEDKTRSAVLKVSSEEDKITSDSELELEVSSTFASELDETLDRNASEIFGKFHRQVWVLVRSLPEILHHSEKIIDLMMSFMLSPASSPERPSLRENDDSSSTRKEFVLNHATADILHLLAVLARDLRHEIHPHVHSKIVPRIVQDLLNPPPPPPDSGKQPIPLDVTIVEATFRTLSYIFRYDSDMILQDMEPMRKYYGLTLASRREVVRRLAAETFAPLIRKIKSQSARQRHLKRVLKALAVTRTDQPMTNSFKRTQSDAVDGISQLMFQIVRGVPGRMHSQGDQTLRFLLSFCGGTTGESKKDEKESDKHLIVSVAASFLERLCQHTDDSGIVIDELVGSMKASLAQFTGVGDVDSSTHANFQPVLNMVQLMAQVASLRTGYLLHSQSDQKLQGLFEAMETLYSESCFAAVPDSVRPEVMALSCSIWRALQTKSNAPRRLEKCLQGALRCDDDMTPEQIKSIRSLAVVLSKDLLPFLTEESAMKIAGSSILTTAARVAEGDCSSSLLIVFSVAAKRLSDTGSNEESASGIPHNLFASESEACGSILGSEKEILLNHCLLKLDKENVTCDSFAQLGVAIRCAPFLTLLPCDSETEKESNGYYKKTAKWIVDVLIFAESVTLDAVENLRREDLVVIKALALEALSHLSTAFLSSPSSSSTIEKMVLQVRPIADRLLFSDSESLWAMRGIASLVAVLAELKQQLNDKVDEVFDTLVPNLRSSSHALRFHTLEILARYPEKAFVTDHADLDLDGDLDEDPSFRPSEDSASKRAGPVGLCDLMESMLKLESTPVRLTNERTLLGMVSRIEVLARTGKLPVAYAEAAANHMLGSFYVKFAPMWPAVARVLVTLAGAHEDIVWPALEAKLVAVMERPSRQQESEDATAQNDIILSCSEHQSACITWENSLGKSISVFQDPFTSVNDGEVPRHLTTDEETVMESVWDVAEQGQQLVAKHSRVIVPVFLSFLHNQYYAFHSDNPDARELNLKEHAAMGRYEIHVVIMPSISVLTFWQPFVIVCSASIGEPLTSMPYKEG
jgi:hypothetical protein